MRRIVLMAFLMVSVFAGGCVNKEEMAARQKAAFEARTKDVQAELAVVLQGWIDNMVDTLPADLKKYPKVQSPLVKWRADTFKYDWRRPVDAAVVKARDLAVASRFEAIPRFFEIMEQFWNRKVMFKDYMVAYEELKKTSDDPLANMLADFDHAFVHVEAFYGAQDMEGDDRAIYFFRHWQVAFNFPREEKESVGEYIARLCEKKLKDYCMTVPFEELHFALEKPYLQEARGIVGSYLEKWPESPLNKVFSQYMSDVDAKLANWKDYKETLVVPTLKSRKPFTHQLLFKVSSESIDYEQKDFLKFSKGWDVTDSGWKSFGSKLEPEVQRLGEERGPENMEVAVVLMDSTAPMSIPARIVQAIKGTTARYIQFAGRNRSDAIIKLTKVGELQFREVPELPATVEIEKVGRLSCRGLGQSSDDQDFVSKISNVVWLDSDGSVMTGTMDSGRGTGMVASDSPAASKVALAGDTLILVNEDVSYDAFVKLIEPVFINCNDDVCKFPRDNEPRVAVSVCGGR